MNFGGSGGAIVVFLFALLSALASLAECYRSYYKVVPRVQFFIDTRPYATINGDYANFGGSRDLLSKFLILVEDSTFGCKGENNDTSIPPNSVNSVFLLPDSGSPCSILSKSRYASENYDASGVIFYRTSSSDMQPNASTTTINSLRTATSSGNRRRQTQTQSSSLSTVTIVRLTLLSGQLAELRSKVNTGSTLQVTIEAQIEEGGLRTTQTFYFVVFAFCILMMLSCSWLLLSYFKRCHYRWRLRRNQVSTQRKSNVCVLSLLLCLHGV